MFTDAILAGTAVLIAWYSYETFYLRKEMKRQQDLAETPIVNLYLRGKKEIPNSEYFTLRNVSSITAYNITIDSIKIKNFKYTFYFDQPNIVLEPNGDEKPLKMNTRENQNMTMHDMVYFKSHFSIGLSGLADDEMKDRFATFLIHLTNLSGKQFYSIFKFYSKTRVTKEFTIEHIKTGEGLISISEADKISESVEKRKSIYSSGDI